MSVSQSCRKRNWVTGRDRTGLTVLGLAVGADSDAGVLLELFRLFDRLGLPLGRPSFLGRAGCGGLLPLSRRPGCLGSLALPLSLFRSLLRLGRLAGVRSEALLSFRSFAGVGSWAALSLAATSSPLAALPSRLPRRRSPSSRIRGAVCLLLAAVGRVQERVECAVARPAVWFIASELDSANGQAGIVVGGPIPGDVAPGLGGLAFALAFAALTLPAELEPAGTADTDAAVLEADLPLFDAGPVDVGPDECRGAAGGAAL